MATDPTTGDNPHYLAKDYASFRALMLEQLALGAPAGGASDAASLEVTLVEVLAYVADYLSYYQDAVATEAYLTTARRRISVRRHARLLDYRLNEGCSARTWVHFETGADHVPVAQGTGLVVKIDGIDSVALPAGVDTGDQEVFETMHDAVLMRACNRMTLSEPHASLQPGDTSARLAGPLPLSAGDVLIFHNPKESYCHAVRLIRISAGDASSTAIEWHEEDELPDKLPPGPGPWIVIGNIVLADHGQTIEEDLPAVPRKGSFEASIHCPNLAHVSPYRHAEAVGRSAAHALLQDPKAAEPAIWLKEGADFLSDEAVKQRPSWTGRRDIVHATQFDRSFAVEPTGDGWLNLRFGDGVHGRRLPSDWQYRLRHRAGRGARGNIGPNTLAHVAGGDDRILAVTNPLAAAGGAEPETLDHVQAAAPHASDHQRRCVSPADYVAMIDRCAGVQASIASQSSSSERGDVSIHVRRLRDRAWDSGFEERLLAELAPFRLIGDQVQLAGAHYVRPLVAIELEVERGWRLVSVADAVRKRILADLAFGFGESLHPAQLIACAGKVAGLANAQVRQLTREPGAAESAGAPVPPLAVAPFEIIELDRANISVTARPDR